MSGNIVTCAKSFHNRHFMSVLTLCSPPKNCYLILEELLVQSTTALKLENWIFRNPFLNLTFFSCVTSSPSSAKTLLWFLVAIKERKCYMKVSFRYWIISCICQFCAWCHPLFAVSWIICELLRGSLFAWSNWLSTPNLGNRSIVFQISICQHFKE